MSKLYLTLIGLIIFVGGCTLKSNIGIEYENVVCPEQWPEVHCELCGPSISGMGPEAAVEAYRNCAENARLCNNATEYLYKQWEACEEIMSGK